jgi:hypothetical protein
VEWEYYPWEREFAMRRIFLILALVLTMAPATVHAEGTTVMIGPQSVSFGADLGKYYDIPPGPGISVLVGFDVGIPLDIRAGARNTTEGNSGSKLKYQWIELGPRWTFTQEGASVKGDWFLGVGSYKLDIGSVDFDRAIGQYIGMGVEEAVSDKYVGRVEIKGAVWKSDTRKTDAAVLNIALTFGVNF